MCSIYAGSSHDAEGGQVDADLKTVFAVVLPICTTCMREGAKIIVGRYFPNGQALLKRLEHDRQMATEFARGRQTIVLCSMLGGNIVVLFNTLYWL